ncbi:MAG: flagellar basal body P-ring protein FlgI [Ignavibacteriae bacterium]|nr:flagellar basal body P-ring protein FlgI [Ignavibacteriota bacterium]
MTVKKVCALMFILLAIAGMARPATRIKDIAYLQGVRGKQVIGYGLVVGLNGTGDTQRSTFTLQSVTSMLKRFGITVPQADLRLRNVAAVMVTATVPSFAKEGGVLDVTVSSMGDATNLSGGTLLMTPLSGIDGAVYAMAQGAISVGGMSVRQNGNEVRRNHTAAGRIPGGAILERSSGSDIAKDSTISVVLTQADFTTANRIAEQVNTKFGSRIALANDGSTISLTVPDEYRRDGRLVEFISLVELLEVNPDVAAKVVINEKTGTIIVGGSVSLLPVAISHGGLNIDIQSTPMVSQPNAFSQGQTVVTQLTSMSAHVDSSVVVAVDGAATVQDVAKALNALKVTSRDIIAIFQALKEAGALKAELVII